jgi:hypothetical protein
VAERSAQAANGDWSDNGGLHGCPLFKSAKWKICEKSAFSGSKASVSFDGKFCMGVRGCVRRANRVVSLLFLVSELNQVDLRDDARDRLVRREPRQTRLHRRSAAAGREAGSADRSVFPCPDSGGQQSLIGLMTQRFCARDAKPVGSILQKWKNQEKNPHPMLCIIWK